MIVGFKTRMKGKFVMIKNIITEFINNSELFTKLILSHVQITLISVSIAIVIGLLIGILISEKRNIANVIISIVNVVYTVPSIALLGLLISITGIGNTTAIIALTIYALLPIVRSTYTGILNIDPNIIEAGRAMGSTNFQILYKIKLPLAFPIIFSSIRNMVTMTIALAGIASFVGAGGLGVAIYRGITTNNKSLLLIGSVLIAVLALGFDFILGMISKIIIKRGEKHKKNKYLAFSIIGFILMMSFITTSVFNFNKKREIQIASKPITESYILAEITGLILTNKFDLDVNITHGVGGGTSNLHPATLKGDFDMYPEYTGTSWQTVLKESGIYTNELFDKLKDDYENKFDLTWRGMFGFNNTYSLGIRRELAEKYNIKTFSDLSKYAKDFVFGAEYDFFEREDGFDSLSETYDLNFKKVVDMDNGLKYQALFGGKFDVITVFTTDGQISDSRIVVLEDDLKFYPSYMAGMVIREDTLEKYPEIEKAMKLLDNLIDEQTMARLNNEVETNNKSPIEVAESFLIEKGVLEDKNE